MQRQQIKKFEKEMERKRKEEEELEVREEEEVRERNVKEFELVQMGLSVKKPGALGNVVARVDGKVIVEEGEAGKKGEKRKFELDEEELIRIAKEDRDKAKKALTEEKVRIFLDFTDDEAAAVKKGATNFWVPSLTPSTGESELSTSVKKLSTICPASDPDKTHPISMKSLVTVNFSEDTEQKTKDGQPVRICPSCKKILGNNVKSYRTFPSQYEI